MNFGELLGAVGLDCPCELLEEEVSCIVTNSAKAKENCIFVCIRGSRFDGHDSIGDAVEAGAKVIVAENVRGVREGGAALTSVNNTRLCASLLYNEWFGRPTDSLKVIGVTGTNGKTSVSYMLKSIFEKAGYSCGLVGTLGIYSGTRKLGDGTLSVSNMTTPDPETLYSALAQMVRDRVEYVFMEVSSHALAQCRTDAIEFDCSVFTNLSVDHLDFHKDMESYYKAKEKLFAHSRRAVVNVDDAAGRRLVRFFENNGGFYRSCSRVDGDFCALCETHKVPCGIEYLIKSRDGEYWVSLPKFSGGFQVMNSLQAAAVASLYGILPKTVQNAFEEMSGICGRLERVKVREDQNIEIFIDYAHTPDALERLLRSIRCLKKDNGRIVLLFGCGGERDVSKRRQMGQIASRLADFVIITSDNSRSEEPKKIISDILKGIDKEKEFAVIVDRRSAIERAIKEYTRAGDILVLAGKGHELYEINAEGVRAFDEREIIREVYGASVDDN